MWYPATVTTAPTSTAVTLEQVKAQCQIAVGDTSRDDQLNQLIKAVQSQVERYCAIRVVPQTVTLPCDAFSDFCRVPEAPIKQVESVKYSDPAGVEQTLPAEIYEVRKDGLSPSIALKHGKAWPEILPRSRITVSLVAGFDPVPADLVAAMLLMIAKQFSFSRSDLLKRREDVEGIGSTQWAGAVEVSSALDRAAQDMLEPFRCWPLT